MLTVLPSSMSVLQPFATSIVCMNLRAIAVLKNSRDCVRSPSSMIFFFSLNETLVSVRVRISKAGLSPLVTTLRTFFASFSILPRVAASRSVFLALLVLSVLLGAVFLAAMAYSRSESCLLLPLLPFGMRVDVGGGGGALSGGGGTLGVPFAFGASASFGAGPSSANFTKLGSAL